MLKRGSKPALISLMVIGLHAGNISMNIARAYDGDIDYSAPYVTLDPKTGKLITVDPKQQQADGQPQPPHPSAPPQDATASQSSTPAADAASNTAAAATPSVASTPTNSVGTNVIAAVTGLVVIAGIVAMLRRKPAVKSDS